jgi:hypothetical protein
MYWVVFATAFGAFALVYWLAKRKRDSSRSTAADGVDGGGVSDASYAGASADASCSGGGDSGGGGGDGGGSCGSE